jgi:hypothetical protein
MFLRNNFSIVILLFLTAIGSSAVRDLEAAFPAGNSAKLDPISAECIGCHDGSNGMHVRFCLLGQKGTGCGGHIVSTYYADLVAAQRKGFQPLSNLPPELVLYQGKITCRTCHGADPHDGTPLAIDNFDSALCRSCHIK